ncbi:helix-turn-helix domain-containing protein [Solitalea koreensis]|uniref:DNA binding domain-containing protein, excisionase family n=1 Tax=Solitalea koreensis TaxID=543615 RepID=A0A521DKS4_9SPHI|nr:helix-turn-helix domain-containing protein [Solitalea koreensis]SMO72334.1 DNA binding domain-containing protein, excisionase family [Solitalea koreensis]
MTQEIVIITNEKIEYLIRNSIKDVISEYYPKLLNLTSISQKEETKDFLTRKQAAEFLNCSMTSLYNYQKAGVISYYQVGRKILFRKSQLLDSMEVQNLKQKKNRK